LDYRSGNVKSVYNLVSYLGYDVIVSNEKAVIESATHIILPGVGSFGAAMEKITTQIPLKVLEYEVFNNKKLFLGICVGMQVLVEKGYEHGEHHGLGWIPGTVEKLPVENLPLPHIGWNDIIIKKDSDLFTDLDDIKDFYFVHSYAIKTDDCYIFTETNYENNFCSSIKKENIYGVQFHPEKSQKAGQKLIQNFLTIS
jgi:imidazole glycerol-phosphate synthase subunit HisH